MTGNAALDLAAIPHNLGVNFLMQDGHVEWKANPTLGYLDFGNGYCPGIFGSNVMNACNGNLTHMLW